MDDRNSAPADAGRLPVFVYGTLKPGYSNHEATLAGVVAHVDAGELAGYELRTSGRDGGPFPYLLRNDDSGSVVFGSVLYIEPAAYDAVLRRLDRLEGCFPNDPARSHYTRERVVVEVGGGTVECWVYLAGPWAQADADRLHLVVGGDWQYRPALARRPRAQALPFEA